MHVKDVITCDGQLELLIVEIVKKEGSANAHDFLGDVGDVDAVGDCASQV